MCRALMPGDEENMSDEAIWETLPVRIYFIKLLKQDAWNVGLLFF